jgi:hypothetical protein
MVRILLGSLADEETPSALIETTETLMQVSNDVKIRLLAAGLLSLAAPCGALAATIPFSQSYVAIHDPSLDPGVPGGDYYATDGQTASNPPSATTGNVSDSGDWGSAAAMASADLTTGQLRGAVSGYLTGQGVYQYNTIYSQTNAVFGDGFRAYDLAGTPFSWQSGSTARFGITVDGDLFSSPSLEAINAGAWVTLFLFQHDTMTPDTIFGAQPNMLGYYHFLIGNPNLQVTSFGPDAGSGDDLQLFPTQYVGDLNSGPLTIVQDFTPGGDFDWAMLLGAYSFANNPGDQFDLDLSHTVTFSYQGPEGTSTQSVSGLFDNYNVPPTSVPEPGTLALLALGLMGLGLTRRKAH